MVVLLSGLGLVMPNIVFHTRPPQSALGSSQPILPCSDGAFPTIQLLLPDEELLLQLIVHYRRCHLIWGRRRPTPINKRGSMP
jgi:hypothetical protein